MKQPIPHNFTNSRLGTTEFAPSDMNELIFCLNTAHQIAVLYPDLQSCPADAYLGLLDILQSIRARRDRTGVYGVSGDELQRIAPLVTELQDWLGMLPAARVATAERAVMRFHERNGPHRSAA